jgi:hypothetical protein
MPVVVSLANSVSVLYPMKLLAQMTKNLIKTLIITIAFDAPKEEIYAVPYYLYQFLHICDSCSFPALSTNLNIYSPLL